MSLNTVRRAQLIAPFGPGGLMVLRSGLSVMTAGLDHWFCTNANSEGLDVDRSEFKLREWRLEQELAVDYFVVPPDHRYPPRNGGAKVRNASLTVPVLRFPSWHVCRFCNRMHAVPLAHNGYVFCPECEQSKRKKLRMAQIRFIAVCSDGHIQDFPWIEWVHRSASPACRGPLYFESKGGTSLNAIRIRCASCPKERGLGGITQETATGSTLSNSLESARDDATATSPYLCRGVKPWLGSDTGCGCQRPLLGAMRSATNVHFAEMQSAIYLPIKLLAGPATSVAAIVEILREPAQSPFMSWARARATKLDDVLPLMRSMLDSRGKFPEQDLMAAVCSVLGFPPPPGMTLPAPAAHARVDSDDRWTAFRRVEFNVLRQVQNDRELRISAGSPSAMMDPTLRACLSVVNLVEKLRETRVFTGFSRLVAGGGLTEDQKKRELRLVPPPPGQNWLPAYTVFGEGLFLALDEERLARWEARPDVQERVEALAARAVNTAIARNRIPERVTARLVLIHTLAHLLINRLVFECGYSSASLRERLFVSDDPAGPMAGLLVYTASGDSEGSLGGLVRMGQPDNMERVLLQALEGARWCSNDPICMESAAHGQGPESLNLAACHSCALLPETACERFNRLLDRGLVVGDFANGDLGFFGAVGVT